MHFMNHDRKNCDFPCAGFTLTNYSEIDKMSKEGMLFLPAQLVLPLLPCRGHDGHPHDLVRLYTPGVCASHYLPGLS